MSASSRSASAHRAHRAPRAAVAFALGLGLVAASAAAQSGPARLDALRADIGFEPPLGAQVPIDLPFAGADGEPTTLRAAANGRPTVLALVYYRCPMLCNAVVDGLLDALGAIALQPGTDYAVVLASIDPREGPGQARARRDAIRSRTNGHAGAAGWSLLTGEERSIRTLADAVGFRYRFVPETGDYAHAAGIVVLDGKGTLTHAFSGIEYPARDLRLAIVEASRGEVGTLVDRLLLLCYHWEPGTGRYGFAVASALQAGGVLTVVVLLAGIALLLRRERVARRSSPPSSPPA